LLGIKNKLHCKHDIGVCMLIRGRYGSKGYNPILLVTNFIKINN